MKTIPRNSRRKSTFNTARSGKPRRFGDYDERPRGGSAVFQVVEHARRSAIFGAEVVAA